MHGGGDSGENSTRPTYQVNIANGSTAESELTGVMTSLGGFVMPAMELATLPPTLPPIEGLLPEEESCIEEEDDVDGEEEKNDENNDIEYAGGDSDEEGPENQFLMNVEEEHEADNMDDDSDECGEDGDCSIVPILRGSPPGWFPPQPPPDFQYHPKYDAPPEEEIDNPGGWSLYSFAPCFDSKQVHWSLHPNRSTSVTTK